jgi:hypothetical protein
MLAHLLGKYNAEQASNKRNAKDKNVINRIDYRLIDRLITVIYI